MSGKGFCDVSDPPDACAADFLPHELWNAGKDMADRRSSTSRSKTLLSKTLERYRVFNNRSSAAHYGNQGKNRARWCLSPTPCSSMILRWLDWVKRGA